MHQPIATYEYVITKRHDGDLYYLKDIETEEYDANVWTKQKKNALVFPTRDEARDTVEEFELKDVFIENA